MRRARARGVRVRTVVDQEVHIATFRLEATASERSSSWRGRWCVLMKRNNAFRSPKDCNGLMPLCCNLLIGRVGCCLLCGGGGGGGGRCLRRLRTKAGRTRGAYEPSEPWYGRFFADFLLVILIVFTFQVCTPAWVARVWVATSLSVIRSGSLESSGRRSRRSVQFVRDTVGICKRPLQLLIPVLLCCFACLLFLSRSFDAECCVWWW